LVIGTQEGGASWQIPINQITNSRIAICRRHGSPLRSSCRGGYDPVQLDPGELFSSPFSAMRRMHEQMDRVFSELFSGRLGQTAFGGSLASWAPAVEISRVRIN
jgi:hypothetical protein